MEELAHVTLLAMSGIEFSLQSSPELLCLFKAAIVCFSVQTLCELAMGTQKCVNVTVLGRSVSSS